MLEPFTLIGATTVLGVLAEPFRARFKLRACFGKRSVGPRPSEKPPGKERRRGDMTENIVEEARRRMAASQPAEARMAYRNRL